MTFHVSMALGAMAVLFAGAGEATWQALSYSQLKDAVDAYCDDGTLQEGADISAWNTAEITTMIELFSSIECDPDISAWNTARVTNFESFARNNTEFNADVSAWNTARATTLRGMFLECFEFDQDISAWNTANVDDISGLFASIDDITTFNQNIGAWNVSKVIFFEGVFGGAQYFNQDLSRWNTANAEIMKDMFNGAIRFNFTLSGIEVWNTAKVTTMQQMFDLNDYYTDLDSNYTEYWYLNYTTYWNTGSLLTLFDGDQPCPPLYVKSPQLYGTWQERCELFAPFNTENLIAALEQVCVPFVITSQEPTAPPSLASDLPVARWNTQRLTSLKDVFSFGNVRNCDQDISMWDVSNVEDFSGFAQGNEDFNPDLSAWNTAKATRFTNMFNGATAFSATGIELWNTANVTNVKNIFESTGSSIGQNADDNLEKTAYWNTGKVSLLTTFGDDQPCPDLARYIPRVDSQNEDITLGSLAERCELLFFSPANKTALMTALAEYCASGESQSALYYDVSEWDTSKIVDMSSLFKNKECTGDISTWNTANVENFESFAEGNEDINEDLSAWNTGNAQSFKNMFKETQTNPDLSGWDVRNVTDMEGMFLNAKLYTGVGLSQWDTSNVRTFKDTFRQATAFLGIGIRKWNTETVTSMQGMFRETDNFRGSGLGEWNIQRVDDMGQMFQESLQFQGDLRDWNTAGVTNMHQMFDGTRDFDVVKYTATWNTTLLNTETDFVTADQKEKQGCPTGYDENALWPSDYGTLDDRCTENVAVVEANKGGADDALSDGAVAAIIIVLGLAILIVIVILSVKYCGGGAQQPKPAGDAYVTAHKDDDGESGTTGMENNELFEMQKEGETD